MPLYEYKCSKCNKSVEEFSDLADRDKTRHCKNCGEELVRSQVNNVMTTIEGYCYNNEQKNIKVL